MPPIYICSQEGALRQGEIITGLVQARLVVETLETERREIEQVIHPYAIITSQDCDLIHDWQVRDTPSSQLDSKAAQKLLPSILFTQMTTADALKSQVPGSDIWKRVRQNKDERYQFLESVPKECDALEEGLPELGIDFKRYFTIPTDEVYKRIQGGSAKRRCRLASPYLEHLSTRFCYYQFRVALPEDHRSV